MPRALRSPSAASTSTAKREYLAAFNGGEGPVRVTVATSTPSASWAPLLGVSAPVSSRADGGLTLQLPPLTAVLLRANADLPPVAPAPLTVRVAEDTISELWSVSATATRAPQSVTIAIRRAGASAWRRLAADDSPPYRAFLDPALYRRGERVHLVAVARWRDGTVTTSPVVPFTVRRS